MSDANRTQVAICEETTLGVLPASPRFQILRVTSESFKYTPKTVVSNELAADLQVKDLIRVGFEAAGDIPIEMSYGMVDPAMPGIMRNAWSLRSVRDNDGTAASNITSVAVSGVYTILASAGTLYNSGAYGVGHLVRASGFGTAGNNGLGVVSAATLTSVTTNLTTAVDATPAAAARLKVVGLAAPSAGNISSTVTGLATGSAGAFVGVGIDFAALGMAPGVWFKASGFVTAGLANNGWYRVLTATALRLECDIVPTGFVANAAATELVRLWMGDYIRNGVQKRSYGAEVQFQDLAVPEFEYYNGNRVSTHKIEGESQDIIKGAIGFMGLGAASYTTRYNSLAIGADRAAPENGIMNTSDNVGALFVGGASLSADNAIMSASLSIDNSLRRKNAWGSAASVDIGLGRCMVKGTMKMYYGSNAVANLIRNGTPASFMVRLNDPLTNKSVVYDVPRIKFEGGDPIVSGVDTDRSIEPGFQGLKHPVLGYTVQFQRFEEYA